MVFTGRLAAGLTVFLLTAPALAAKQTAEETAAKMTAPPVALGNVALGLIFVVALILLLAWILKKLGHGGGVHSKNMRTIATLPVGARERAVLVQVGEQQILLGVAPGRVNCLHVFDTPVITPTPNSGGASGPLSGSDIATKFKEILNQKMGRP